MKLRVLALAAICTAVLPSCNKDGQCPNDLRLKPMKNESRRLRLDGYYFTRYYTNSPQQDSIPCLLYTLYANGMYRFSGIADRGLKRDSTYTDGAYQTEIALSKESWGTYRIDGDAIVIQGKVMATTQCYRALEQRGVIISDTSFDIIKIEHYLTGGYDTSVTRYFFHSFSPKPDSTNLFIR